MCIKQGVEQIRANDFYLTFSNFLPRFLLLLTYFNFF